MAGSKVIHTNFTVIAATANELRAFAERAHQLALAMELKGAHVLPIMHDAGRRKSLTHLKKWLADGERKFAMVTGESVPGAPVVEKPKGKAREAETALPETTRKPPKAARKARTKSADLT